MSVRQRSWAQTVNPTGGGGSVPTVGNVIWGPNFGQPQELTTRSALSNPAIGLAGGFTTHNAFTNSANAANYNAVTTHSALTGTALGAPFWQSVQTGTSTASPVTVSVPAGTVSGDLLLVFVSLVASGAIVGVDTPSGWSRAITQTVSGATNSTLSACYYRISDGTETSQAFTFTTVGTLPRAAAEMHRIIGVNTTTPINVSTSTTLLSTALVTDPVSPSVTTTVVNCLVFAHLAHDHLTLSQTHTPPASNVEATDFQATNTANIVGSTTDWRAFASSGATGTATHDCTETVSTDAVMLRVAIAPGSVVLA